MTPDEVVAVKDVCDRIDESTQRHPVVPADNLRRMRLLADEAFEVAEEVLRNGNRPSDNLRYELLDVAAFALRWAAKIREITK